MKTEQVNVKNRLSCEGRYHCLSNNFMKVPSLGERKHRFKMQNCASKEMWPEKTNLQEMKY